MRLATVLKTGYFPLVVLIGAASEARVAAASHVLTTGSELPPAASLPQDPGDSIYRAARSSLTRGDYARAAELFRTLTERYPRSGYSPDALYWEAFARYRQGGSDNLRTALARLDTQAERHPKASTRGDARTLAARIRGALAASGDARAAEVVTREAHAAGGSPARPSQRAQAGREPCPEQEDDVRATAINALLHLNAEQAVPILKKVVARRDACSAPLREKAVFLLSQKRTPETEDILLSVARNDPAPGVREKAVHWLSQVPTPRALATLEEVLRTSSDDALRGKALFALSQHSAPRAAEILRSVAEQPTYGNDLREKAIFWLAQQRSPDNAAYLRSLYGRLEAPAVREKVLFALSQMGGEANARWLLGVAADEGSPIELRKKAIFHASQTPGIPAGEISALYDRTTSVPLREQIIFALSQRSGAPAALDKLISIARTERVPELRKKAIFWLSQSRDPRAGRLLEELINQ